MNVLIEENPYGGVDMYGYPYYLDNPWYGELVTNPRRKKRKSKRSKNTLWRNPMAKGTLASTFKGWSQGVELMDVGAGVGGLAAATMIPGYIITVSETTLQKLLKIGVSAACALAAGMVAQNMGARYGKAAVLGGLVGTGAHALAAFTPIVIGAQSGSRMLGPSRVRAAQIQGTERQPVSPFTEDVIVTVT